MGFSTRKVKIRRHNGLMRLYAATVLVGVRYDRWPAPRWPRAVEAIDTRYHQILPYRGNLGSCVVATAKQLGIK